jgi:hypothetical protein
MLLLACDERPLIPSEGTPVASVEIVPDVDTVALASPGDSLRLQVEVRDTIGALLAGAVPTWASVDPRVATVDSMGLVTARDSGNAMITASVAGKSDTLVVVVMADQPPPPPPPPPVPAESAAVLVAAGDIAGCTSGYHDDQTAELMLALPSSASVVTLGDNAYPDGTSSDYSQCYAPTWGQFKSRTFPSPGNHDYHTAGAPGYFGYFESRAPAPYYSYDLGSWHLVSLNSEVGIAAQSDWLAKDLRAHPAKCTLAYWHKPLFTTGKHSPATETRPLWDTLYRYNADLVLVGHNHHYERWDAVRPDGTPDLARGIREFVVGTGGANTLYDFTRTSPNSLARYKGYGVLKLTLEPTTYSWIFLPISGSYSDSGTQDCH